MGEGETRRRRTGRPWAKILLFLALFLVHCQPVDEALANPRPPTSKMHEKLIQAASVGGSQEDDPRPGNDAAPGSQQVLQRGARAARDKATRTSRVLTSAVPGVCPRCRWENERLNADEGLRCWVGKVSNSVPFNSTLTFNACVIFPTACPFLLKEDPEIPALPSSRPPTAEPKGKAAVVGEESDPRCPISTAPNSSFLATYGLESCHDFFCKLEKLSEARVDHGYVEEYYGYPGPLPDNGKRCMEMAKRNGSRYHQNEYLHMLSFNVSKTLPLISVIIYKSPPNVPFHELAFLLLRENRDECIKRLFPLVTGILKGEFGSIYLTDYWDKEAWSVCRDNLKLPLNSFWRKVVATNPARIVSVAWCSPTLDSDLTALLVQGRLRAASSTINELYERQAMHDGEPVQFSLQGRPVLAFDMPRDAVLMEHHPLVTENKNALHCTSRSGFTLCRGHAAASGQYDLLFVGGRHEEEEKEEEEEEEEESPLTGECSPSALTKEFPFFSSLWLNFFFFYPLQSFYSLLVENEVEELNLCASDTLLVGVAFKSELGFCSGHSYYLLAHGEMGSMTGSRVIRPSTDLRVYHLGAFLACGLSFRLFKVVEWENPYLFFTEYGVPLREVLAQLERLFGVDEPTLLAESKYRWYVRTNVQAAVWHFCHGETECLDQMTRGKSILYEEDTTRYITGAVSSGTLNTCSRHGFHHISLRSGLKEGDNRVSFNVFWPSCGTMHSLVQTKEPVTSEWSYLSTGCRITQIFLFLVTAFITAVTIGGNSFVIYIIQKFRMYEMRHYGPAFFILRSLAIADLLSGLFPGTLAVWDQFRLMTGLLTLRGLDKNVSFDYWSFYNGANLSDEFQPMASLRDVRFEREGYAMFCSYVLSVSSIVSLLMLGLLSVERYRGVKNVPFPCFQAWAAVSMSWFAAAVMGILLFIREDGFKSAGYFDPISKLTVSAAHSGRSSSFIVFWIQVGFVGGVGLLMILMTFYTFHVFMGQRKDREKTGVTAHPPRNDADTGAVVDPSRDVAMENLKFFRKFFVMMFLYVVSVLPLAVSSLAGLSELAPLFQFFAWWFFKAGGSWNWYIYTYRRAPFRKNVKTWKMGLKRRRQLRRELRQIHRRQKDLVRLHRERNIQAAQ